MLNGESYFEKSLAVAWRKLGKHNSISLLTVLGFVAVLILAERKGFAMAGKLYFRHGAVSSAKTLNLLAVAHNYRIQKKNVVLMKPALDVRFGAEQIRSRAGLSTPADFLIRENTNILRDFPVALKQSVNCDHGFDFSAYIQSQLRADTSEQPEEIISGNAVVRGCAHMIATDAALKETETVKIQQQTIEKELQEQRQSKPSGDDDWEGSWQNSIKSIECILVDEAQFLSTEHVDQLRTATVEWDTSVICYGLRTDFRTHLFPGSKRLMEVADSIEEVKTTCFYCGKKATLNLKHVNGIANTAGPIVQLGAEEMYYPTCFRCFRSQLANVDQLPSDDWKYTNQG